MTWVRLEDTYPINRKVAGLSDGAFRLDVEAICWSNRETTDGVIRADELPLVRARATRRQAGELVAKGRWHQAGHECPSPKCPPSGPDGWVIHDYLEYQPTRDDVTRERAAKTERQRRWRDARRRTRNASTPSTPDASPPSTRDGPVDASTPSTRDASRDGAVDALVDPPVDPAPRAPVVPLPPRPEGRRGAGRPAATTARRQAADAASGGREDPPTSPPEPASGHRRAALAADVRAAIRGRPTPARLSPTAPVEPSSEVDNPAYDPAVAAKLAELTGTPAEPEPDRPDDEPEGDPAP